MAVGAIISACYDKINWSLNTRIHPANEDFLISIKADACCDIRSHVQQMIAKFVAAKAVDTFLLASDGTTNAQMAGWRAAESPFRCQIRHRVILPIRISEVILADGEEPTGYLQRGRKSHVRASENAQAVAAGAPCWRETLFSCAATLPGRLVKLKRTVIKNRNKTGAVNRIVHERRRWMHTF